MSRHEKFKVYWESMGRPDVECKYTSESDNGFTSMLGKAPSWADHCNYRIAGDRHWKLREKWIDSYFTLPIERKSHNGEWFVTKEPLLLFEDAEYREAKTASINDHQPEPEKNNNPAVWSLVMADMVERDIVGSKRYGTRLQPHNGRDALIDAYQEVLDTAVYLRQAIFERDGK